MGISIADNFNIQMKKPLDNRTQYATLALMKAVSDSSMSEGCLAYCEETDKYYKFLSTNDSDEETGKWREYESGGGLIEGYAVPVFGTNNEFVALLNEATGYEFPSYNDEEHTAFMAGIGMSQYPNEMAIFLFNTNDSYLVERINTTQIRITNKGGHNISFESATSVPPNGSWGHAGKNVYGQSTTTEGVSGMDTIYIRGNITIADNNFVRLPDPLKFYEDKEHTVEIEPEIGKQYIDRNTNKMYRWNGVSYVCISGEFDESTLYSIKDEAETTLDDADYLPFYDVSASTKKKSLWSNIKSVLKTYFDAIYNQKLTAGTSIEITSNNVINAQMPVMGTFSKGDLYDTTEKVIGKWTDGRPLYQKTFSGTMPSSGTDLQLFSVTNYLVKDIEGYTLYDGTSPHMLMLPGISIYQSKTTNSGFYVYNNYLYLYLTDQNNYIYGRPYVITLRYTKSTDSANTFNYASENDYSTTEHIIGTWVNGETLYQRTFTGTTSSSSNETSVASFPTGYYVRSFEGGFRQDSGTFVPISYCLGSDNTDYMAPVSDGGYIKLLYGNWNKGKQYWLTVKYTK